MTCSLSMDRFGDSGIEKGMKTSSMNGPRESDLISEVVCVSECALNPAKSRTVPLQDAMLNKRLVVLTSALFANRTDKIDLWHCRLHSIQPITVELTTQSL